MRPQRGLLHRRMPEPFVSGAWPQVTPGAAPVILCLDAATAQALLHAAMCCVPARESRHYLLALETAGRLHYPRPEPTENPDHELGEVLTWGQASARIQQAGRAQ